jgi:hypothetical protein
MFIQECQVVELPEAVLLLLFPSESKLYAEDLVQAAWIPGTSELLDDAGPAAYMDVVC